LDSELLGSTVEPISTVSVLEHHVDFCTAKVDYVATEEPLELRVVHRGRGGLTTNSVAVTMRTPGSDFELAVGYLYSEGVIRSPKDVEAVSYCTNPEEPQRFNIVNVKLADHVAFNPKSLSRNVFTSSACGVCGKASIDHVRNLCATKPLGDFRVKAATLVGLLDKLGPSQRLFTSTGGLHAAALFNPDGSLVAVREDVGRHNAMDKLVGHLLLCGKLPASNSVVMVSGRASYELVQKAVVAGVPALVAVGAPSSLAVDLAREFEVTLVGFLRRDRFNVYSGPERII
jgi:FdhD protein